MSSSIAASDLKIPLLERVSRILSNKETNESSNDQNENTVNGKENVENNSYLNAALIESPADKTPFTPDAKQLEELDLCSSITRRVQQRSKRRNKRRPMNMMNALFSDESADAGSREKPSDPVTQCSLENQQSDSLGNDSQTSHESSNSCQQQQASSNTGQQQQASSNTGQQPQPESTYTIQSPEQSTNTFQTLESTNIIQSPQESTNIFMQTQECTKIFQDKQDSFSTIQSNPKESTITFQSAQETTKTIQLPQQNANNFHTQKSANSCQSCQDSLNTFHPPQESSVISNQEQETFEERQVSSHNQTNCTKQLHDSCSIAQQTLDFPSTFASSHCSSFESLNSVQPLKESLESFQLPQESTANSPDLRQLMNDIHLPFDDIASQQQLDQHVVTVPVKVKKNRRRKSADFEISTTQVVISPDIEVPEIARRSRRLRRKSIEIYRSQQNKRDDILDRPAVMDYKESTEIDALSLSLCRSVDHNMSSDNETSAVINDSVERGNIASDCTVGDTIENMQTNQIIETSDVTDRLELMGMGEELADQSDDFTASPSLDTTPEDTRSKNRTRGKRKSTNTNQAEQVKAPKVRKTKPKPEVNIEDLYLNKQWRTQMPSERTWETIYEEPRMGRSKFAKRFLKPEEFYTQAKLKRRRNKAIKLDWKPLSKKKLEKAEALVHEKLLVLDQELTAL